MTRTTAPPLAPSPASDPFTLLSALAAQQARPTKGGLWREEVLDRAGRLKVDLALLARHHGGDPQLVIAWEHVADAMALTEGWVTPSQWWSGSRIEDCWRRLRQAEEAMLDLGSPEEVLANIHEARNAASFYLGDEDSRTKDLVALLDAEEPPPPLGIVPAAPAGTVPPPPGIVPAAPARTVPPTPAVIVPTARIALAASHEVSDRQHRESRSFINTLRVVILLLAVLVGAFAVAVKAWDLTLVPATDGVSQPVLVGVAVLFGALGAMFSAIPPLAQMPSRTETFNPVRTQAVLKVVVGSWSAVIGLMAVSANLTTAETRNLAGFAMVAAIFGASQEALTRFADRKARDLGTSGGARGTSTA